MKKVDNAEGPKSHPHIKMNNKPKDLTNQLKIVFLDTLKNRTDQQLNNDDEVDMSDYVISDSDAKLVDMFLTKFTIVSESSMNEHLDIMLMLKALPNKVTDHSREYIEMFNFRIF